MNDLGEAKALLEELISYHILGGLGFLYLSAQEPNKLLDRFQAFGRQVI